MVAAAVVRGGGEVLEALALLHKRVIGGLLFAVQIWCCCLGSARGKREKVGMDFFSFGTVKRQE